MKKSYIYFALACVTATGLQSCLDYDDPGDELNTNQVQVGSDKFTGGADELDFDRVITAEEAQTAIDELSTELAQCKTGVYNMRGGKEGGVPAAHSYQYQYNLEVDNYAQYFVTTHKDFPYSNAIITSTYNMSERFNGASHSGYNLAKVAFPTFLNNPKANDIPEIKAVFLLYFDLIAQENADISGPFTYTEDKMNSEDPQNYESVRSIYYDIKDNLDNIIECFKYFDNRDEDYKLIVDQQLENNEADGLSTFFYMKYKDENYEPKLENRFDNYIRLANSLKLRMAMHMVKVEPETAQQWAEEAVAGGVIESIDQQQGVFPSVIGFTHPLVEIANSWNDTRISASFESLLMSLDHPFTKYLFKKNSHEITNLGAVLPTASLAGQVTPAEDRIIGIRSGSLVGDGQSVATNPFIAYSSFNSDAIGTSPLYFISYSEVNFLRAEGALRGWNMGGNAEDFYYEGIRYAYIEDPYFLENGWVAGETYNDYLEQYMQLAAPVPYVQVEPQGLGPDWKSVTNIGVAWNAGDDLETKLEKIITQKYIALFPNSLEAWVDLRRTGYPKLFPVLNYDEGDGSLGPGDIIRRVPWASTDPIQQKYINATGILHLGGDDLQATRIWWDVMTNGNF